MYLPRERCHHVQGTISPCNREKKSCTIEEFCVIRKSLNKNSYLAKTRFFRLRGYFFSITFGAPTEIRCAREIVAGETREYNLAGCQVWPGREGHEERRGAVKGGEERARWEKRPLSLSLSRSRDRRLFSPFITSYHRSPPLFVFALLNPWHLTFALQKQSFTALPFNLSFFLYKLLS